MSKRGERWGTTDGPPIGEFCLRCDKANNGANRAERRAAQPRKWVWLPMDECCSDDVPADRRGVWYCSPQCEKMCGVVDMYIRKAIDEAASGEDTAEATCTQCGQDLFAMLYHTMGDRAFCSPRCMGLYDRINPGEMRKHCAEVVAKVQADGTVEKVGEMIEKINSAE